MDSDSRPLFDGAAEMEGLNEDMMMVEMEMPDPFEEVEIEMLRDQQYLQAVPISGQDVNDWTTLPQLPERQLGLPQSVSNIYRSSFTILDQAWQCSPALCIPDDLRLATPYSLGLTVRLAELALLTRGCKDGVHAALSALSQERRAQIETPPGSIRIMEMARSMPLKRYTEHRIKECVAGLMIADVEAAKVRYAASLYKQQLLTAAENRETRAANRMKRSFFNVPVHGGTQHRDPIYETRVGAGSCTFEPLRMQKQLHHQDRPAKQFPNKVWKRRSQEDKGRRQRAREEGMKPGRRVENQLRISSVAAADGEQMCDAEDQDQDQDMDSMSAPPNSPHKQAFMGETPTQGRIGRRRTRKRTRMVDGYISRLFEGISMEQGGPRQSTNGQSRHKIREPAFLKKETPRKGNDVALPFERQAIFPPASVFDGESEMGKPA